MSFGNNTNTLTYGNLTASGSFGNLSSNLFSSAPSVLDYLIVGGGGGSGNNIALTDGRAGGAGGGGGGAVLRSFNTSSGDITTPIDASSAGVFTIVVGAGGAYMYNGVASSITASGISLSAGGGLKGSNSSATTGGAGGASGNGNSGSANGQSGYFTRTLCTGSSPNFTQAGQGVAVAGGNYGGAGGGAGGSASGANRGIGLDSSITGSNVNYAQGGRSYLGTASVNTPGRGGQAGAGDNEYSLYTYSSPTSCGTTSYNTIWYRVEQAGLAGAVYLRWSGQAPSSNVGGTLSTVGGDNLLSYTTAGTYTLIF